MVHSRFPAVALSNLRPMVAWRGTCGVPKLQWNPAAAKCSLPAPLRLSASSDLDPSILPLLSSEHRIGAEVHMITFSRLDSCTSASKPLSQTTPVSAQCRRPAESRAPRAPSRSAGATLRSPRVSDAPGAGSSASIRSGPAPASSGWPIPPRQVLLCQSLRRPRRHRMRPHYHTHSRRLREGCSVRVRLWTRYLPQKLIRQGSSTIRRLIVRFPGLGCSGILPIGR